MIELRETLPMGPESVEMSNNRFVGVVYIYRPAPNGLQRVPIHFNAIRGELPSFKYRKPVYGPDDDVTQPPPAYLDDESLRTGYFPIAQVTQALRLPHHMDRQADGLFAVVYHRGEVEDQGWKIKYFPRHLINDYTWTKAARILRGPQATLLR